jgi:hypothetical protein
MINAVKILVGKYERRYIIEGFDVREKLISLLVQTVQNCSLDLGLHIEVGRRNLPRISNVTFAIQLPTN